MSGWPKIFTALVTPFDISGELDDEGAATLAEKLASQGSGGFMLCGSTGEAFSMSLDERFRLFRSVRDRLPATIPVWLGCGTNDTRTTVELTEAADAWGVDGVLLVTPYYNKPTSSGLVSHFVEAAAHTTRPVMLYNVPSRTAVSLPVDVVIEIMNRSENVVSIKEAAGTMEGFMQFATQAPNHLRIYSGDDGMFLPAIFAGADGVVSVASHVAGQEMARVYDALQLGQISEVQNLYGRLWPLFKELFRLSNPIPLKWLLSRLQLCSATVRLPLEMPNNADEVFARLWQAYTDLKA